MHPSLHETYNIRTYISIALRHTTPDRVNSRLKYTLPYTTTRPSTLVTVLRRLNEPHAHDIRLIYHDRGILRTIENGSINIKLTVLNIDIFSRGDSPFLTSLMILLYALYSNSSIGHSIVTNRNKKFFNSMNYRTIIYN